MFGSDTRYAYFYATSHASGPVSSAALASALAAAVGLRWLAGGLLFHQFDALALLLSLAGLAALCGGLRFTLAAAPAYHPGSGASPACAGPARRRESAAGPATPETPPCAASSSR